jgi:hypothetical protein
VPVLRELVFLDLQHLLDGGDGVAAAAALLQDLRDRAVAPAPGDVRPHRLAVPVREVARGVEVLDRRQLVALHRFAHPHRGVGIDGPEREVLRHAFDEPQRELVQGRLGIAAAHAADVVLEGVDQLVAEHVIGLGQRAREREHHAPFQGFGDAARPLAE